MKTTIEQARAAFVTAKIENRFSRLAFGGGAEGERLAQEALAAHEALLIPGTRVRVYRGSIVGSHGVIVGEQRDGRSFSLECGDGLGWVVESRDLELYTPEMSENDPWHGPVRP